MVRGFSVSVWLLALTAPFVGAATADATRDAASAMPQDGVTITTGELHHSASASRARNRPERIADAGA